MPGLTSASGGLGAFSKLYDSTLGVAAASFDITSLPANYATLLIQCYLRGDANAATVAAKLRMNNDSGANYWDEVVYGDSTSAAGFAHNAATSMQLHGTVDAGTAPASAFSIISATVFNYAGTVGHKVMIGQTYTRYGTSSNEAAANGGLWGNTAAINRLTILPSSGNWDVGSRCAIWGLE